MFFVLHFLILIILEVSKTNSFSIKREINPDGKDLTENENFFKLQDGAPSAGSTHLNHNSLFKAVQNVSSPVSTTQNLKADLLDKMLSEEMFSMKEFLFNKKSLKFSTPSLEIKQKWPVLELMSKLNNINTADEYKDDSDVDVLENFKVIDSATRELINIRIDESNVTKTNCSNKTETFITPTIITTTTDEIYDDETPTIVTECTSTTEVARNIELLGLQQDETNKCERNRILEKENLKGSDEFQKKVIELRSLKHHKQNKKVMRSDGTENKNACTCKKLNNKEKMSHSTRCTASMHVNNNGIQGASSPYCTSSGKEPQQFTPDSEPAIQSLSYPNVKTICYPIPTTTFYTTCYTIYSTNAPSIETPRPLLGYQPAYQPYIYQPYQMFVQEPLAMSIKKKEYKLSKYPQHKYKKHKERIDNDDELYYEDIMPNYDDYLDNTVKKESILDNDFREVILQKHDSIDISNKKLCTKGVDHPDKSNNFIGEVVNDLKKFYGGSVLKNCYCAFRSSASAISHHITLPLIVYLCLTYFLNLLLFY